MLIILPYNSSAYPVNHGHTTLCQEQKSYVALPTVGVRMGRLGGRGGRIQLWRKHARFT